MVNRVQKLELDVIEKLRSGFEINSLASVVSELVQNSIDAKATKIEIRANVSLGELIVQDNGIGIQYEDLKNVALRYYSSKSLSNYNNQLILPKSYGFRGEALAAISNFSILEIHSQYGSFFENFFF